MKTLNDLKYPMSAWDVAEYLFGKKSVDENHLLAGDAFQEMAKAGWTFQGYDENGDEVWQPPKEEVDGEK